MCCSLLAANAHAYAWPSFHAGGYQAFVENLKQIHDQIKAWSETVGSIKRQIQTLQTVSNGIRDLKGVLAGGVKGITGEVANALGLDDVLVTIKETQDTYTDGMALYRDAKQLPEDAKGYLKDIGLSVQEIKDYVHYGLMYETFSNLGVEQWKAVAKTPIEALKTGAFGRAIEQSDSYLDGPSQRAAFAAYYNKLSPEEKKHADASLGTDYAAFLTAQWFTDMESRVKRTADFNKVSNSISALVEGEDKTKILGNIGSGSGKPANNGSQDPDAEKKRTEAAARDIQSETEKWNAATALNVKINANASIDNANAYRTLLQQKQSANQSKHEMDQQEQAELEAQSMTR